MNTNKKTGLMGHRSWFSHMSYTPASNESGKL